MCSKGPRDIGGVEIGLVDEGAGVVLYHIALSLVDLDLGLFFDCWCVVDVVGGLLSSYAAKWI